MNNDLRVFKYFNNKILYLIVYTFSIYALNYEFGEFRTSPYTLIGYGLFVICFGISILVLRSSGYKLNVEPVLFSVFLAFNFLSLLIFLINGQLINMIVMIGTQLMVFFSTIIMVNKYWEQFATKFFNAILLLSFIILLTSFLAYLFGPLNFGFLSVSNEHTARLSGSFGSPNRTSSVFAIAILILLYIKSSQKYSFSNWYYYLIVIMFFIGLILTGSRGAWISFVISFLYLTYRYSNSKTIYISKVTVLFIFFTISVFLVVNILNLYGIDTKFYISEITRLETIENQIDFDREGSGRAFYWRRTFELFIINEPISLLFGSGVGTLSQEIGKSAHSGYLNVLIDRGLISLLLFLMLILLSFWVSASNKSKNKKAYFLISSIILFCAIKNISNNDVPSNNYIGFIFVSCISIIVAKTKSSIRIENKNKANIWK